MELVPASKRMFGSDTPQGNIRILRTTISIRLYLISTGLFLICLGQDGPITSFGPKLGFKACLDRGQRSNGHGITYYTIRSGPKVQWA